METLMGVYTITHIASGKQYIGASVRIGERWTTHRRRLRKGQHESPMLQQDWDRDGSSAFSFAIVEIVAVLAELAEAERRWLKAERPAYNCLQRTLRRSDDWTWRVKPSPGGIYAITYVASGWQYIGSSRNLKLRFKQHRQQLRKGTHPCADLQRLWTQHGAHAFVFEIVQVVDDVSRLHLVEQQWLDGSPFLFNRSLSAYGNRGLTHTRAARDAFCQAQQSALAAARAELPADGDWLTLSEATLLVGRSREWVNYRIETGVLHASWVGPYQFVRRSAVAALARLPLTRTFPPPDAGWLTLKQAASILGVTPERVRVLVKQGRLTAKRVGQFIHVLDANLSDPDVRHLVCRGWMGHRATPVRGENSGTAKLTRSEVVEILGRKGGTESMAAIGRDYGVTHTTIRRIWDGQTWALYLQDTATDALAGPATPPGSGLGSASG